MTPDRRAPVAHTIATLALVGLAVAACSAPARSTFPPLGSTPAPAGDSTAAARQEVVGGLAQVGLQAVDASRPYRPAEGPLLAAAPRTVLQATLPDDPNHGYIVIYALASPNAAHSAAVDHAAYVASRPGNVQFAPGSRFVLRVVGSNVVFFTWSPGASPDPRTQSIEDALLRIGSGVTVAS